MDKDGSADRSSTDDTSNCGQTLQAMTVLKNHTCHEVSRRRWEGQQC